LSICPTFYRITTDADTALTGVGLGTSVRIIASGTVRSNGKSANIVGHGGYVTSVRSNAGNRDEHPVKADVAGDVVSNRTIVDLDNNQTVNTRDEPRRHVEAIGSA